MLTYTAASGQEGIFDSQDNTLGNTVSLLDYEIYIIWIIQFIFWIIQFVFIYFFLGLWLFAGFWRWSQQGHSGLTLLLTFREHLRSAWC